MYADDVCSAASETIKEVLEFLYDILITIGQKTSLDSFLFQIVLGRPPLRAWSTGLYPACAH